MDRVEIEFAEHRLDNGLRLLVHPDAAAPVVAVHLMLHVGSKNEPPGRTGFAHLFEHLLFQGSEHVPSGMHFRTVQDVGGTLNGSTWLDRTNYFEIVPINALDLALWLESDRLGWFLPGLTEEKFEAQRAVVMNERRQRYENQPYGLWLEKSLELLYPPRHPYRHPTIGSMADLEAATLDDARRFFRDWYRPDNAALVLAGAVDPDDARSRVERWFGDIPSNPGPAPPVAPTARLDGQRRLTLVEDVELPRVFVSWHAPAWAAAGFHELSLAAAVLADDRWGRLYRDLVYERGVAQDVMAMCWPQLEDTGLFLVILTGKPDTEVEALISALDEAVERLAGQGPTAAEMERARNRAQLAIVHQLRDVGGRADLLAHAAVLLDDPRYVERQQDALAEVDAEAVRDAVQRWLAAPGRAVVAYEPKGD